LLYYYSRYLEPESVIVIDNASWYCLEKIWQICHDTEVVLEFLLLYSPDFNPIKEFFGVLKKFVKKKWHENEDLISGEFRMFLEWCVGVVGNDAHIAENHFCHAGISITHPKQIQI
jgi:transposase